MASNLTKPTSSTPSPPASVAPALRTRRGKIARLASALREEINRRLDDGESGAKLISWLNGLPEVQKILADEFSGIPLSEQNLSQWKQGGGFADWKRLQEARTLASVLLDDFNQLKQAAGDHSLPCLISVPLAVALGAWLRAVMDSQSGLPSDVLAKEGISLLPIARELSNLRRVEQREIHLRLERERWDTEQRGIAEERARKAEKDRKWEEGRAEREASRAQELSAFTAGIKNQFG